VTEADAAPTRWSATAFDERAVEYDSHRPTYPDDMVDQACRVAGLRPGDRVLEVGCGTGQLTRGLLNRGLRVTAVEPGARLLALAQRNLEAAGAVEYVNARFEDARLAAGTFRAVFSASAFHWTDPTVSWRKAADVLEPGGTLALLQYFGLEEPRSKPDQDAVIAALGRVAPAVAARWPTYRDLGATLTGTDERRGDVAELWSWLGSYDLRHPAAGRLFTDVQVSAAPMLLEHTASELNALVGTLSAYASLSPGQQRRSSTVIILVTARCGGTRGAGARP
jgi:ubiquinone/menaquinone biosynthesis C-methylase UbiE